MHGFTQTILIDAAGQARAPFVTRLRAARFQLVALPPSGVTPVADLTTLAEALDAINLYSAVVFHDAHAVRLFADACASFGIAPDDLPPAWCIDGAGIAEARAAGIDARRLDRAPGDTSTPPALGFVENQFYLLLTGDERYAALAARFTAAAARLNVVPLYASAPPPSGTLRAIDDRLAAGAIDCITFHDPAEVRRFAALLPEFRQATVLVAVADLRVATAVMAAGLRVDIIGVDMSDEDFAAAITERLRSDEGGIEYNPGEQVDVT